MLWLNNVVEHMFEAAALSTQAVDPSTVKQTLDTSTPEMQLELSRRSAARASQEAPEQFDTSTYSVEAVEENLDTSTHAVEAVEEKLGTPTHAMEAAERVSSACRTHVGRYVGRYVGRT